MLRVERLIGPHQGHKLLRIRQIDDIVGIARDHIYHRDLFPADFIIYHRVRIAFLILPDPPELDQAMAGHHHKLLILRVMPVLPLRDTGLTDVDGYLASVRGPQDLRKDPPSSRFIFNL